MTFVGPAPSIGSLILKQSGHVNISSDNAVTLASLDLGTYPTPPGVLSGTATINVTGVITGDGGWMRGTGTTNALGGIAGHFAILDGRILNSSGTATGHVGLGNGSVINNLPGATWTMINGFDSDLSSRFNNMGLVRWNVPSPPPSDPPLSMFAGSLNNTGTIEVHAGRVVWGAGESLNSGTIKLFDGVKLEINSDRLLQEAIGSLQGPNADLGVGTSNPTTLLLNGQVSLRDVTFRHGEMSFLGSTPKGVRTLTAEFHSTGAVQIDGSGTTIGRLVASGGEVRILGGTNVIEDMTINGQGVVSIMTGGNYSPAMAFALTENGTLWIHPGSGFFLPGSAPFSQTAGLVIVDGKLIAPSAAFTMFSKLGGHGLVDSSLLLGGTLDPGASPIFGNARPGKLTIAGDLDAEPSARFTVHIGGPPSSGEFDSLAVGGQALIDGLLQIQLVNGFVPMIGEKFIVLTAASRTGTFASIIGGKVSEDLELVPIWEGSNLVLVAVPEPSTYVLMIVGAGFVACCVRRRRMRRAVD